MTGPEHYRAAERLLSDASFTTGEHDDSPLTRQGDLMSPQLHAALLGRAQAHATLALAAATALSNTDRAPTRATIPEWNAWQSAAGVPDPSADYDIKQSFA